MSEEEYIPKQGDIVESIGINTIGIVLGWMNKDTIVMQSFKEKYIISGYYDQDFSLIMKKEELESIASLPKSIALIATQPE